LSRILYNCRDSKTKVKILQKNLSPLRFSQEKGPFPAQKRPSGREQGLFFLPGGHPMFAGLTQADLLRLS